MKTCHACGSSARLRFDHQNKVFRCVEKCISAPIGDKVGRTAWRPKKKEPLFSIWVLDEASGERTRATRAELRTATRLWYAHKDVREGRVHA